MKYLFGIPLKILEKGQLAFWLAGSEEERKQLLNQLERDDKLQKQAEEAILKLNS